MNKTLKRQVFRHTALYTAILMFSHTGGGGGGGGRRKPVTTLLS
ncbi:type IV pilus assembly protein PilC [Neisseria gonorrhoeae]|nr:type IV pilus assembly protein PilC [Neisseria gonorrhoeae]